MRYNTICDDYFCTTTTFNGDLTTTSIYDTLNDISATGHSKRHPEDDYNELIAEGLATARALGRYARKMERFFIRAAK